MKKKKREMRAASLLLAGTFALTLLTGCGFSAGKSKSASATGTDAAFSEDSRETRKKTSEIEDLIQDKFYFKEDPEKREEGYYDGLMQGLDDPYSVYYTPEEYQKLQEDDGGQYVGIGATVSKDPDTGLVYIVKPLPDSPALEAGLQSGDTFIEVDGTEITKDMELEEVVKMIRGKEGSKVRLKMYRSGDSDYRTFEVDRRKVDNVTVESELLSDGIGYISVSQFIENTPEQFEKAVDSLQDQGAKGLVIDLRDNPGGLLTAVLEMADYIIPDDAEAEGAPSPGLLLQTKDKNGKVIESYSCSDKHSVDLPMAILVNGNSASASEVFTGCMKDYGLAEIVGTTTFGKGIVQQIFPLSDGSAVKLTVAKYFTPAGNDIHKKGIDPDDEVELDSSLKPGFQHWQDNQLGKALEVLKADPLPKKASDTDARVKPATLGDADPQ